MKRHLMTAVLLGTIAGLTATPAQANNAGVESALANYSDVSLFYQALVNTGVINELNENTHYTIFAPTNEAFAEIRPSAYPCFYAVQCRPQLADVLRDHIVVGRKPLKELVNWAEVPTTGRYRVYVESPYVGDYNVANHRVLSHAEMHGNMIYRIDGVIINDAQLAQFRSAPSLTNAAITERRTITTYRTPSAYLVPGGYGPATETVTEKTYVAPDSTVIYPERRRMTTVRTVPGSMPDDVDETTTVTHTITTEQ
jgi:uncharacterized surface protein with fasciclin (FAS1) repeats